MASTFFLQNCRTPALPDFPTELRRANDDGSSTVLAYVNTEVAPALRTALEEFCKRQDREKPDDVWIDNPEYRA